MARRSLLPVLLATFGSLLTVTLAVAVNVATGGTLPGPMRGYEGWAWPVVGVVTVTTAVMGVLEARELQATQRAQLAEAPAPPPAPEVPQVVGDRVSTAVEVFQDRIEFRARLRTLLLVRETPIVSVTGRRGIGKSGLVATVLAEFEEPGGPIGGLVYLSTRTNTHEMDLGRVFHALAELLPDDERDRLEELWTNASSDALPKLLAALQDLRAVVVLDNLDDLQDPESGELKSGGLVTFLTAVCRRRQPPMVVTTSQRALGLPPELGPHVTPIEIHEGLKADDAVKLLRRLDADGRAGLRDLPDAELRRAVERVYGMPRGLELLVNLLAGRRTETLNRILEARDTPEVLLGLLVSESFQSLDPVGRDICRLLALADTPLPIEAFGELLAGMHPPSTVARSAEALVNRHMLGFDRTTRRARLHPLDSDYVRGTLTDAGQRAELDLRLADWLATQRADKLTWRTTADVTPQRREIRHRLRAGDRRGAIRVIADIADFVAGSGETRLLSDALEQTTGAADTPELRTAYERSRGAVEFSSGSLEEAAAAYRAGREAALEADDELLAARLALHLGNTLRHMGDPGSARAPLEAASQLPPTDQERRAVVLNSLFVLGLVECYLDNVEGAGDAAARCEALLRPGDPPLWQAWLADLKALVALLAGDHPAALAEIERGIAAYADSPEQSAIGYLRNVRGLVHLAQGRTGLAAGEFLAVREDAAARLLARLEGMAALNLAWTQLLEGDRAAAAALAHEAADRLGANRVREAQSAVELAAACEADEVDERVRLLRRAVTASLGNPDLYRPSEETLVRLAGSGSAAERSST